MRHGMNGRKLNRNTGQRKALFRGLARDLIKHEQITTTLPKAKDLRPIVEKMVTWGKKGDLAARREALSYLEDAILVSKIMGLMAERYKERQGGYLRVLKAGFRAGDAAPMAYVELVDKAPPEVRHTRLDDNSAGDLAGWHILPPSFRR